MTFPPADRGDNLAIWVVLWFALFAWQAVTARRGDLPSFASLVHLLRFWWITRWGLLLWWGWLGWHVWVRTTF